MACSSLSSWEGGDRGQESEKLCLARGPAMPASTRHNVFCYGAKKRDWELQEMKAVSKEPRIKPYLDHQHIIKALFKMKRRDMLSAISGL